MPFYHGKNENDMVGKIQLNFSNIIVIYWKKSEHLEVDSSGWILPVAHFVTAAYLLVLCHFSTI